MSFFQNIKSATHTNAHGEVGFFLITGGAPDLTGFTKADATEQGYIVGHSESGHNHVLERGDVEVMEGTVDGMKVLYALLREPLELKQTAGAPHAKQVVQPGAYFITNNVEYNPFTEQARRVAD
jgi:hypothetical protein